MLMYRNITRRLFNGVGLCNTKIKNERFVFMLLYYDTQLLSKLSCFVYLFIFLIYDQLNCLSIFSIFQIFWKQFVHSTKIKKNYLLAKGLSILKAHPPPYCWVFVYFSLLFPRLTLLLTICKKRTVCECVCVVQYIIIC